MITIEDKFKAFAEDIIGKVQQESEQKLSEFSSSNKELLDRERQNILKEAETIIEQMRKKAEADKEQIISKAKTEKDYAILVKKKDMFERVFEDIKKQASEFASGPEYYPFLEMCMEKGLSRIKAKQVTILLLPEDLQKYGNMVSGYINKKWAGSISTRTAAADEDIIGGCIVQNMEKTMRVDCSIALLLNDSRELIGKTLMESL